MFFKFLLFSTGLIVRKKQNRIKTHRFTENSNNIIVLSIFLNETEKI